MSDLPEVEQPILEKEPEEKVSLREKIKTEFWDPADRFFGTLFKGISGRWLNYTIAIFFALFFLFILIVFLTVRSYMYSTVDEYLEAEMTSGVETYFAPYLGKGDAVFDEGAHNYVSKFDNAAHMEAWVIDKDGTVVATTNGFEVNSPVMDDYYDAIKNGEQFGYYTGKNQYGEHIKSATMILTAPNGETGYAVRYIASMEGVRTQLRWLLLDSIIIILLILIMIAFPSISFIRSLVKPITELNDVTKKIASGDSEARVAVTDGDDEISELGRNLNFMADELASTEKMKNDFISTVSHEMKTPLTAIKGWAETVRSVGADDPVMTQRALDIIVDEAGRLTGVVEDLLDLSKISNGRLSLKYSKIDLLAELDDTIFVFKDRSKREGIELVYNAPAQLAPAEGDPDRIQQVFVNVLDNAFKYNKQNGTVTVVATILPPVADGEKGTLKIQVEDTGCGIAAEDLPKVKKKFYKSNISVQGSGIGLAVCDEIVKMHQGTLDVESELGVGTCVTICLPIEYVEPEPAPVTMLDIAEETPLEEVEMVPPVLPEEQSQSESTNESEETPLEQSTQD